MISRKDLTLRIIFSIPFLLFPSLLTATDFYNVKLSRVVDGDTISVNINYLPDIFGREIRVRLAGIDTPEIRGNCVGESKLGMKAKKRLTEFINQGEIISLRRVVRGKFFRLIGDVEVDGVSASQTLLDEGLAKPYSGGARNREQWCSYRKKRG